MTEQVSLQRPLQTEGLSDAALEEINRLWTIVRAFSTTAHDVNNALQVIAGSAELLESRDLEPLIRRRVEAIRIESGKAAQTIDRLLSYARAPRQAAQRLDLWHTIDTAVGLRLASLGRLRISLSVERGNSGPVYVTAETAKLLQAVLNLLLIAEDTLAGLPRARITVCAEAQDGFGVLKVQTSADSDQRVSDGQGEAAGGMETVTRDAQGWAAVRIARAHGGDVVASGTELTLRWPS